MKHRKPACSYIKHTVVRANPSQANIIINIKLKYCDGLTPYYTYQKSAITFAACSHNVNVLLRNNTFLIFAVLVVCRPCRR